MAEVVVHMIKSSDKKGHVPSCGSDGGEFTSWWREVSCELCIPAPTKTNWLAEASRRAALDKSV